MSGDPETSSIILFDGVCNLCNRSVQFILRRDPRGRFRFAAIQSEAGQRILRERGLPAEGVGSIVLLEGGVLYTKSTAGLRIARGLTPPWPLLSLFLIVPRFLRDPVYRLIARNRYRFFGKQEACMLPTPDTRARFLT